MGRTIIGAPIMTRIDWVCSAMRLPASLRAPQALLPTWLIVVVVGTVLMILALFFILLFPWGEAERVVLDRELPREGRPDTSLRPGQRHEISIDAHGTAWILHPRPRRVALDEVEATVRGWRTGEARPLVLRLHREARWSAARDLLGTVARAGRDAVYLASSSHGHLEVHLVEAAPDRTVTLDSLPLEDFAAARRKSLRLHRQAEALDKDCRPIVRLKLPDVTDVQSVVDALRCYASEEGAVYLALSAPRPS
jgi:hypothetical protein